MKPYPKYKDSGIEWIGEIPALWESKKIRYMASLKSGESITSEELVDEGKYPVFGGNGHRGYSTSFTHNGRFVLIGRQGALCGNINYGSGKFWASEHAIVVSPLIPFETTWMGELLRSLNLNRLSVAAAQPGLAVENINVIKIPIPPFSEQQFIATYLDRKTKQIDGLIEKKQNQIELLREQRTAVINEAVTKGLNPKAKMKDSGIEWIGEMPEHWECKQIKHIKSPEPNAFVDGPFGSNLKSIHFVDNGDVYVIESGFITSGSFVQREFKTISRDHYETIKRSTCKAQDIIIAKIGANYGMSGILPKLDRDAVVSGNSLKLTVDCKNHSTRFIHYQLLNLKQGGAINLIVNLTAQPALSLGGMNDLKMAIPPKAEQEAIVSYLDHKTSEFDTMIAKEERLIELLQEYRTSLISEVVTGKVDVRKEN